MITIPSFKVQRDLLLVAVYKEGRANPNAFVDTWPQAKLLGIDDELLNSFVTYYSQAGLAKSAGFREEFYNIALTPAGIDYVEASGLLTKTD